MSTIDDSQGRPVAEMTPTEQLRAAAARVFDLGALAVTCACPGSEPRWSLAEHPENTETLSVHQPGCELGTVGVVWSYQRAAGQWMALMSPWIAGPLAAWLESTAEQCTGEIYGATEAALTVARALLATPDSGARS